MLMLTKNKWYIHLFGIDYRTLAVFRVGLALSVLAVVWTFMSYDSVNAFLSDTGIYRRTFALEAQSTNYWSLYYFQGGSLYSSILLICTVISALSLMLGFHTRCSTVVCWILIVSLVNRTPILAQGGDIQLCVMLFWAMFLPLGEAWSADSSFRSPLKGAVHCSLSTAAILLQVTYIYFFGALHKVGAAWVPDGTAVYYALNNLEVSSTLSAYLHQYYEVTRWLTYYVYYLELLAPALLFSFFFLGLIRGITVFLLVSIHLGFSIFLNVGIFPLISIVGLMVFIPGKFWSFVQGKCQSHLPVFVLAKCDCSKFTGNLVVSKFLTRKTIRKETLPKLILRSLIQVMLVCFIGMTLIWNVAGLPQLEDTKWDSRAESAIGKIVRTFRINQYWNMFAPYPGNVRRWHVIEGLLENGDRVDLLFDRSAPAVRSEPDGGYGANPNQRWRKFLTRATQNKKSSNYGKLVEKIMGEYFCRRWNSKDNASTKLVKVEADRYWYLTPEPFQKRGAVNRETIMTYDCYLRA